MAKIEISLDWLWYDGWMGYYWDRQSRTLYIGLLPTVILRFRRIDHAKD